MIHLLVSGDTGIYILAYAQHNFLNLGGQNCRMAVWTRMEKPELMAKLAARKFTMTYGNYEEEVARTAKRLGLKVLT